MAIHDLGVIKHGLPTNFVIDENDRLQQLMRHMFADAQKFHEAHPEKNECYQQDNNGHTNYYGVVLQQPSGSDRFISPEIEAAYSYRALDKQTGQIALAYVGDRLDFGGRNGSRDFQGTHVQMLLTPTTRVNKTTIGQCDVLHLALTDYLSTGGFTGLGGRQVPQDLAQDRLFSEKVLDAIVVLNGTPVTTADFFTEIGAVEVYGRQLMDRRKGVGLPRARAFREESSRYEALTKNFGIPGLVAR